MEKFCPNCGHKSNFKFCPNCGFNLSDIDLPEDSPENSQTSSAKSTDELLAEILAGIKQKTSEQPAQHEHSHSSKTFAHHSPRINREGSPSVSKRQESSMKQVYQPVITSAEQPVLSGYWPDSYTFPQNFEEKKKWLNSNAVPMEFCAFHRIALIVLIVVYFLFFIINLIVYSDYFYEVDFGTRITYIITLGSQLLLLILTMVQSFFVYRFRPAGYYLTLAQLFLTGPIFVWSSLPLDYTFHDLLIQTGLYWLPLIPVAVVLIWYYEKRRFLFSPSAEFPSVQTRQGKPAKLYTTKNMKKRLGILYGIYWAFVIILFLLLALGSSSKYSISTQNYQPQRPNTEISPYYTVTNPSVVVKNGDFQIRLGDSGDTFPYKTEWNDLFYHAAGLSFSLDRNQNFNLFFISEPGIKTYYDIEVGDSKRKIPVPPDSDEPWGYYEEEIYYDVVVLAFHDGEMMTTSQTRQAWLYDDFPEGTILIEYLISQEEIKDILLYKTEIEELDLPDLDLPEQTI